MKTAILILLVLLPAAGTAGWSGYPLSLECSIPPLTKHAPHGEARTGGHQTEVLWARGHRILKDEPPYGEPLDGLRWTYCGYHRKTGLHMLLKADHGVFTGVLIDDQTGALLPGGEKVLFSGNRQHYLVYEQPDGQDGETIKLFRRDGTLLWKGYNGLLTPDRKYVMSEFENMHWDDYNRLRATARDKGKAVIVTLTRGHRGQWEWLPRLSR